MNVHIRNLTVLLITGIIFVALLVLAPAYRELLETQEDATQEYQIISAETSTAYTISQTENAPTITHTVTPSPSKTLIPTATNTFTVTPTITLTPTPQPCLVRLRDTLSPILLYGQPSRANMLLNETMLRKAKMLLFAKIKDEPWYFAAIENSTQPQGWIHKDDLDSQYLCVGVPEISLSVLAEGSDPEIILEENFSRVSDKWRNETGAQLSPSTDDDGFGYLSINTILNNAPVKNAMWQLKDPILPSHWQAWVAWERESLNGASYLGFRIYPENKENTYVELRFLNSNCNYEYWVSIDGVEMLRSSNQLKSACTPGLPDFVSMTGQYDNEKKKFIVNASLNGIDLLPFDVADTNGLFATSRFNLISSGVRSSVQYILIVKYP